MYKTNVRLSQNFEKKQKILLSIYIYYEISKIQNRADHYFTTRKIYNRIAWIYS